MTIMKKLTLVLLLSAIVFACGKTTDKRAQLEGLKKEHQALGEKIKALESELKVNNPVEEKAVSVMVTAVNQTVFNHYIEIQGKVDGENNVGVSPQVPGTVTAVFVKEGDRVRKGQVLAQLDDNLVKQQVNALNQQLEFAKNLFQKQKNLWEKEIGSEIQYLTAKNQKEALEKNMATLNEQVEMYRLKSPIDGTVEEVGVKIGQMAAAGVLPAFRVVNFNSVKVYADVAEAYAPKVKSGNTATVLFPDFNVEIPTTLNFSSRYINPTNRTFQVEIRLGKSEVDYRANMLAIVRIVDYTNPSTMVLPVNLIKEAQDGKYTFVCTDENGKKVARKRIIEVGQTYNGLAEVLKGLNPGDQVISKGQNDMVDGQIINVVTGASN
jgi:membrane fusion protein, multidrug efflux system